MLKQILWLMGNKKILKIRRFARDFACKRPDFMVNVNFQKKFHLNKIKRIKN